MRWIIASLYEPSGTPEIRPYRKKNKCGGVSYGEATIESRDGKDVMIMLDYMLLAKPQDNECFSDVSILDTDNEN